MTDAWRAAMRAMVDAHFLACRGHSWTRLSDEAYADMLRAALPHALRAVVEKIPVDPVYGVMDLSHQVQSHPDALLAALTAAAGRLGT